MNKEKIIYKERDISLLEELCLAFGPTGCEEPVAKLIEEKLSSIACPTYCDRMGNLIAKLSFGEDKLGCERKKLMISAHMDEVGFMITELSEDGTLLFGAVGGIDDSVVAGRRVKVGDEVHLTSGLIASKAIHHKSKEEREKPTPKDKLYIDIGSPSLEETKKYAEIGSFAVFDSEFYTFGEGGSMVKSKALDDRLGCAVMIEVIKSLLENRPTLKNPLDVYFAFTVREEIGLSGAKTAAFAIRPDLSLVLETTAVADIADVPDNSRVAELGRGGVISLMDRSTIYGRRETDFALDLAKKKSIPVQVKKYVSGGNDAGSIHKSAEGVRTIALSAPTRYLHSPACVASLDDYDSMIRLTETLVRSFDEYLEKEN